MDKQFLEFWSKLLALSAQGKQPMEEIGKWCAGNFDACQDITGLWSAMYGLGGSPGTSSGTARLWQEAMQGFQQSYAEFMAMLDFVPRKDYDALAKENETLKNTVHAQEEQIAQLRALLAEKFTNPRESLQAFQGLMNEQVQSYQNFVQGMTAAFQSPSAEPAQAPAKKKAKSK